MINLGEKRTQFPEQIVKEFFIKRYSQGSSNQINEISQMIRTEIHRSLEENALISTYGTDLSRSEEIQLEEYLQSDEFLNSVSSKLYDYQIDFSSFRFIFRMLY